MKVTFENFGRAHIVRIEEAAAYLKMIIGGSGERTVYIDGAGHIGIIPPDNPNEEEQQLMELMQIAKRTVPTVGKSPYVTACDILNARILAIENEMMELDSYDVEQAKTLERRLLALREALRRTRCLPERIDPNSDD
ncbi:hypothetical protein U0E23_34750 [Burkholderia stagnalis]|uniref:hypothetical protein n=1 Tax=Burkholderia stagnalis TaxID=1503054 RepID=UPI002AB54788|nr:hypothetical protein [Burkholderia stagnalis]MDY7807589.1 hypothetical protein [Burkholderia stagnalis]